MVWLVNMAVCDGWTWLGVVSVVVGGHGWVVWWWTCLGVVGGHGWVWFVVWWVDMGVVGGHSWGCGGWTWLGVVGVVVGGHSWV